MEENQIMIDIAISVDSEGNVLNCETLEHADAITGLQFKTKLPFIYWRQIDKFRAKMTKDFKMEMVLKEGEKIDNERLASEEDAIHYDNRRKELISSQNKLNRAIVGTEAEKVLQNSEFKIPGVINNGDILNNPVEVFANNNPNTN